MNNAMKDYSEKRDFIRMQVDTDIDLRVEGTDTRIRGRCVDLSATGMAVELNQELSEGIKVHASLASHNPEFPPFETLTRVLRCEQQGEGGAWLIGLEIEQVER